jgi:hypothetical protein
VSLKLSAVSVDAIVKFSEVKRELAERPHWGKNCGELSL